MSKTGRDHYDVSIIGAGPTGAVAAVAHARRGARVLLVEANPAAASRLAGEWLHPPGVTVLDSLGLLPIEAAAAHGPGHGMVVFPDDGEEPIRLPYPDGATGLSCDHHAFVEALRERAEALPGVDYLPGARVVRIDPGRLTLRSRSDGNLEVSTGRIVGAEGRNSVSRAYLGLSNADPPVSYMAGIEMRGTELPFEGYGHVILGGPGPILMYRIGRDRVRACLDLPIERCPRRRDAVLLWRSFRSVLPNSMLPAFRDALLAGRVLWTTTRFRPRSHYGRGELALVGDAVGYFHPLTAAGMTLGFQDATLLAASRNVEEYRKNRERQSYVAELLSTALYHVMSHEGASTESIRTAVYRMWGDSDSERTRTMRMLISEDHRSASFAAAFLKVAVGAVKHLVRSSSQGEWRQLFPGLVEAMSAPRTLLQWPAALLVGNVIRATVRSRGTHLRVITPSMIGKPPGAPAASTPRPSEMDVRVGLASAFGALTDFLDEVPTKMPMGDEAKVMRDLPRVLEALRCVQPHLPDGPDISAALASGRRRIAELVPSPGSTTASDAGRLLAEAALATLVDCGPDGESASGLRTTVERVLTFQRPSGGFVSSRQIKARRWLGRVRESGCADVSTTAVCCRALAEVHRRHPGLFIERLPLALARARTWLADRQSAAGFWTSVDRRPSIALTAVAMKALLVSGTRTTARPLRRAGRWLCGGQTAAGTWSESGITPSTVTARAVGGLIAARPLEVDAIERGVNALLKPSDWNAGATPATRDLCDIAEGLAAFLDWNQDVPSALPGDRSAAAWLPSHAEVALSGRNLET